MQETLVAPPCLTLDQITERHAFLLAQVQATATDTDVIIDVPSDALVANNKASRRFIEFDPSNKGKWRWPAGGVGIILQLVDCNVFLTLHRDKGAPSYGGHDTLSSGLGSSVREFLYPLETAWREGAEECCIVTPDGIVCPIPETDHFGFGLELTEVTRGTANLFPELAGKPIIDTVASFLPLKDERQVTIRYAGKMRQARGLVVFDPNCNGIDLLKAVVVPVNCALADLTVYDGELAGQKPLNRQVNAYALDDDFRPIGTIAASWVSGQRIEAGSMTNPMTPVLKSLYEALTNR
jgi:hypothetical protein